MLIACGISTAIAQTHFDLTKKFPFSGFNPNVDINDIEPVKSEHVATIFNYISKQSKIQFNYPQGGCPERAQMMHLLLDSMKFNNFKIWIFAPTRMTVGDTRKISVPDNNGLSISTANKIEWDFHVASCIIEEKSNGKRDTLVIDPSINADKPLPYKSWLNSITNKDLASYTFTEGKYYSFNRNGDILNGFFYPYSGLSYDDLWLEKAMAMNDVAIAMFKKYVQGKDPNLAQTKAVIQVIENSATLNEVLRYKDGKPWPAKIRSLTTNHSAFIAEAWSMYAQRLAYWGSRVSSMF